MPFSRQIDIYIYISYRKLLHVISCRRLEGEGEGASGVRVRGNSGQCTRNNRCILGLIVIDAEIRSRRQN